jgi:subtilisin family serine protease
MSSAEDKCGHGTHVAGIAAAKDNSFGVVGIAPDARLWAIKVLELDQSTGKCKGSISAIIGAVNYVTQNADQIDVTNLSVGCKCNSTALDKAIHNSVTANVTYVAAAGNTHSDAATFSPANNTDVIAVSAITDRDGKCGGLGPVTWVDAGDMSGFAHDDTFATFSNYGSAIDIAAPGIKINSTYLNGTYHTMDGSSMAAPHVTGAAALYKDSNPTASLSDIRTAIINSGSTKTIPCDGNGHGYFNEDGDNIQEPLLHIKNLIIKSNKEN